MTHLASVHADHGATVRSVGGVDVVANYGRPARAHGAVRSVVGVHEPSCGVIAVAGDDRRDFVDDVVTNAVPAADGTATAALLLDPDGAVRTDMYVLVADDRLLVLTPPGQAGPLAAEWADNVFLRDVTVTDETDELAVFGVHGPKATEKIASVFTGGQPPAEALTFDRGSMGDAGVTVLRTDGLTGETGYLVVAGAADAADVFDTLVNRGLNAAPFGRDTWSTLTLEAGSAIFPDELAGRIPNGLGLEAAIDHEKGCYVGQEVVSRIENRGRPPERLVGLRPAAVPAAGATVYARADGEGGETAGDGSTGGETAGDGPTDAETGDPDAASPAPAGGDWPPDDADDLRESGTEVGVVTRAAESPTLEEPVALAVLSSTVEGPLAVLDDGDVHAASVAPLPFVEGSARSARCPDGDGAA